MSRATKKTGSSNILSNGSTPTNSRMQKIDELLHRALAKMISSEIDDPRLVGVTVVGVKVSKDLSIAKVYVTFFDDSKVAENLAMLNDYAKRFRGRLAAKVKLRKIPALRFYHDDSLLVGNRMNALFANINNINNKKIDKTN